MKNPKFLLQKLQTSTSEEAPSPPCPHWTNPDCGRLLWTAPERNEAFNPVMMDVLLAVARHGCFMGG